MLYDLGGQGIGHEVVRMQRETTQTAFMDLVLQTMQVQNGVIIIKRKK